MSASAAPPVPEAPAKGPSLAVWLGGTVLLTLVAAGGGGFLGLQLVGKIRSDLEATAKPKADERPIKSRYAGDSSLRDLPPIVTNLASPANAMIRLQATIVLDGRVPHPELITAEIGEDLVAFLRTVPLRQIEGASGLAHLRDDLNERAAIRSENRVRELIIQSIVIQ
jgi:flagellar FliL protein